MKVEIDVNSLREMMHGLKKACNSKSTLDVLSCAFLRVNGGIHIWTTDLDTYVRASPKGIIHDPGEAAFRFAELDKVLRKINKHGGKLTVETEGDEVVFTHPKIGFRLPNMADEFPTRPGRPTNLVKLDQKFREELEIPSKFYSSDKASKFKVGVNFVTDGDDMWVQSTDGHRGAHWKFEGCGFEIPEGVKTNSQYLDRGRKAVLAWGEAVETAAYIMGRKKTGGKFAYIGFADNDYLCLTFGRYEVFCRIVADQNFPDMTMAIPMYRPEESPVFSRKKFLEAVDMVSIFASSKTYQVVLHYKGEVVEVSASYDGASGETVFGVIPGKDTRPVKAGFNYTYLKDAVRLLDSGVIGFYLVDTLTPLVMWADGQPDKILVVMPMKL